MFSAYSDFMQHLFKHFFINIDLQPIFAALDYSSVYVTSGTYGCRLGDAKTLNCKGILFEPLTNFGTNCIITTQLFCSYVVYHHKSFMWHFSFCWSLFRYVCTYNHSEIGARRSLVGSV